MNDLRRQLKRQKNLVIGGLITLGIVILAIFAPLLAPYDPINQADLLHSEEAPNRAFHFGTDTQGRDILSRVIYGARISLSIGLVAQCLNSVIGVLLGLTAGFLGRWWDDLVMGLTNIMLSIPALVLALAIMAVLGPGLWNVFLALGFTNWSYSCRVTRSQVLAARSLDYVTAARALGCGRVRIMLTQVLPNIVGPILVIATLGVAYAILTEASLSFLGLGAQPPTPSWGGMLSTAREQLFTAPWISIFPGLAIFITVLGLNLLGDGLRDILDPHTTRQRS
ncbi:MAG: ABC transporter permease [candidate division NC10 bacterium]|nr:ABC transporter permease [candidate division NC10 bacterium]